MSLATPPIPTQPHRFTTERYHRLIDSGALVEDDRVELLNGIIVDISPIGSRHCTGVHALLEHFSSLLTRRIALVAVQSPIYLNEWSEPKPDLWIAAYKKDRYRSGIPRPADLFLVAEVADTSLDYDTRVRLPLYAQAQIPEAWLFDVISNTLTVYREPRDGKYHDMRILKNESDRVSPIAFPECELTLATLLE